MKTKIALLTLAIVTTFSAYSQVGRPSFGIRAGVNFQNLNGKDAGDDKLENNLKVGFNAGVNAELPVAEDFYIQPGVLYSTKGAKLDDNFAGSDVKVNLGYIEIPINLIYKPALGQGNLLMGFGPYIAFAVNGQVKDDNNEIDVVFDKEVSLQEYSNNPYVMKRFDAGANLLFGYEFNRRVSAQLNAQLGLMNLNPELTNSGGVDLGTMKNTGFGISLGYRF